MAALSTARSGFWYYMTTCISDGEDEALPAVSVEGGVDAGIRTIIIIIML